MEKELITLSTRELERLRIVSKVMDRSMTQMGASAILGISDRQIRNLIVKIREKGNKGSAHGNRGRESPKKLSKAQEANLEMYRWSPSVISILTSLLWLVF